MKENYYDQFVKLLDKEKKDQALAFVLDLLENDKLTLEELYQTILAQSLTNYACVLEDQEICVWKEHTRTSIVRTILEATYPYVVKRKLPLKTRSKKVIVVCPQEEYHEIGAIMVTNFFSIAGFDAQYIGANTPKNDILSATRVLKPDFLALSVTDYYNLVITKKITEAIKESYPEVKIIVGGQAFKQEGSLNQIKYDYHIDSVEEIYLLAKAVLK